jgi:hypothetical protein
MTPHDHHDPREPPVSPQALVRDLWARRARCPRLSVGSSWPPGSRR